MLIIEDYRVNNLSQETKTLSSVWEKDWLAIYHCMLISNLSQNKSVRLCIWIGVDHFAQKSFSAALNDENVILCFDEYTGKK